CRSPNLRASYQRALAVKWLHCSQSLVPTEFTALLESKDRRLHTSVGHAKSLLAKCIHKCSTALGRRDALTRRLLINLRSLMHIFDNSRFFSVPPVSIWSQEVHHDQH